VASLNMPPRADFACFSQILWHHAMGEIPIPAATHIMVAQHSR
jgi:hypothetical protein